MLPFIALIGTGAVMTPLFWNLFRDIKQIEKTEIAQGRKDWYIQH